MSTKQHEDFVTHVAEDKVAFAMIQTQLNKLEKSVRKWGLLGGFLGGIAAAGIHMLGGCTPLLGRPTELDIATYTAQQQQCVADFNTRIEIDACRATYRQEWCSHFPDEVNCAHKDAGDSQ
jgi:hypothetical protein